jgi:hypothetical protein
MSLSSESAAQLGVYAQIAVGFAGFSGVIGAFSRFRIHAEATAFRVRAMVVLALMEAVFSLLPTVIAGYGVSEQSTWRIAGGLLGVAGAVAVMVMARQASRLYRIGRLIRWAAYVLCALALATIVPLLAMAAGIGVRHVTAGYFTVMFCGVVVCAYHFVMLMIAVRLDETEA